MIHHKIPTWQELSWRDELKQLITDPNVLFDKLELDASSLNSAIAASSHFQLRVTPSFANKMKKGDLHDPLLKQVLPVGRELETRKGFSSDPLAEAHQSSHKGIIHKYRNRILLMTSTSCAINCRYCFRREFDYNEHRMSHKDWVAVADYVRAHDELDEVILSGGDPLLLNDSAIKILLDMLADIPHLETIRVHTRIPVVLPSRITSGLIEIFQRSRLNAVWVLHSNHANELGDDVGQSLRRARFAGISLLNQTVLLKGINDTLSTQERLSKKLLSYGVMPYYLHLLDRVNGSAHFDVAEHEALVLFEQMRTNMSGYLVPRLVREVPGEASKTLYV